LEHWIDGLLDFWNKIIKSSNHQIKIIMKLLIIKPSSLGDIANTMAIIPGLRKLFPESEVHWLANKGYVDFVKLCKPEKVLIFDRSSWKNAKGLLKAFSNFFSLCRQLRAEKYDIVLDLQGLFRSGWFALVTGAWQRIGFSGAREKATIFYNRLVDDNRKNAHAADCGLEFLKILGMDNPSAEWSWPDFAEIADPLHQKYGLQKNNYIDFIIGTRWETKEWLPEYFAETAIEILKNNPEIKIILNGTEDQTPTAEYIKTKIIDAGINPDSVVILTGKIKLTELTALLSFSRMVLSSDTGPMHIAASLGTKIVALMGPTDPIRHGPYNQQQNAISVGMDCGPCHKKKCPDNIDCMRNITPKMVLEKIRSII